MSDYLEMAAAARQAGQSAERSPAVRVQPEPNAPSGLHLVERHLGVAVHVMSAGIVAEARGNTIEAVRLYALSCRHNSIAILLGLEALAEQTTHVPARSRLEDLT